MKAILNNSVQSNNFGLEKVYFVTQELNQEVSIVDYFEDPKTGQLIISLYSQLFSENQQKIYIRDNKLIIIVSEIVHSYKSNSTYVSDWQTFSQQSYIRMRNVSLLLPGDNFYLIRHFLITEQFLLKIILGKNIHN